MRYHLAFAIIPAVVELGIPGNATAQGIRNFCAAARPHVEADFKLSDAVRQVFGQPYYGVPSQQDAACIYPLQVLCYGSADVLLTMGNEPGQACHGCSASLSAYFLARTGGGLKLVNKAVDFGQVLGQFPPSSLNALIGPEEVEEAMSRSWREEDIRTAPRILGVDVAQFGDDASAIVLRRGLQAFKPRQERNLSSTDGAAVVADEMRKHDPDAVFIDSTGGYGAGWIDRLRELGHTTIGVNFSGKATETERYFNKRAEMYLDAVEWIRRGGALWRSPRLKEALVQTTYSFKGGRLLLEPKEQIKARLGYSPDEADALALTFAAPVASRDQQRQRPGRHQVEYDPFASITRAMDEDYDPFNPKGAW